MTWSRRIRVEFNHCDPAGIVFYPRYFEMTNAVVENFFREVIELPFEAMMAQGQGVPAVRIETDFHAPSRLGDMLDWVLTVEHVGGSSTALRLDCNSDGAARLTVRLTLVFVTHGRPTRWPDALRAKLEAA